MRGVLRLMICVHLWIRPALLPLAAKPLWLFVNESVFFKLPDQIRVNHFTPTEMPSCCLALIAVPISRSSNAASLRHTRISPSENESELILLGCEAERGQTLKMRWRWINWED